MKKTVSSICGAQTFYFKSRCKHCKSGPKYVYYTLRGNISTDTLYNIKDFYEHTTGGPQRADDFYVEYAVKSRKFGPSYMFDSTSLAYRRLPVPNMRYQQNADKFGTVIECDCGETSWSFVRSNRKHISNRKCGVNIPVKDILSLYRILL